MRTIYSDGSLRTCVELDEDDRDVAAIVEEALGSGAFNFEDSEPEYPGSTGDETLYFIRMAGGKYEAFYSLGELIERFGFRLKLLN